MKILIVLMLSVVLGSPSGLMSQNKQPGDRRDNGPGGGVPPLAFPDSAQTVKIVDELASELSLTDKQKDAVLEIHLAHFKEAKKLMDQTKSDRKSHRDKMEALRKDFHSEIKKLLSDEQYKKFENYMKKHDHRPERPQRSR